jgi:predicted aspartyl protease
VDIGFDPNFKMGVNQPVAGITGVRALVDTGASESCIDSLLAAQLKLPIVDRRKISGVHGSMAVNMYLAQIRVPSLDFNIYGALAGVRLELGGQWHKALIGRTFLRHYTMVYEGNTGSVTLASVQSAPSASLAPGLISTICQWAG